jgi:hypothetical protein
MARKKRQGTEGYLDTVNETLREYEKSILQRATAVAAMVAIDKTLADLRERLLHLAGGAQQTKKAPSPPKPSTNPKKRSKQGVLAKAQLADQDPRIQRSIGTTLKALQALGGSAHRVDVAKKLGISDKAADLRMTRGIKLGLIKKLSPGTYEAL